MILKPLRGGAVTDFDVTARMLAAVMRRCGVARLTRPRVLACVPSSSTPVERRAVEEAVRGAGARQVVLVDEPLAAAIGAGLPVNEPIGSLLVDVGGGRTELGIVSMGGVVTGHGVHSGGSDFDAAIQAHIRAEYGVAIGEKAAEDLKIAIGSALPGSSGRAALVIGRETSTGSSVEVRVSEDEIRQAMATPIRRVVEAARNTIADAPPELTQDALETGMFLVGGGSLLSGLDLLLAQECEVPVHGAERPRDAVVLGAGHMLEHLDDYQSTFQFVRGR